MNTLTLDCDATPALAFLELLKIALQPVKGRIELPDLGSNTLRIETDDEPTSTGELLVTFYPSDSFLRLAATLLARKAELCVVENAGHGPLLVGDGVGGSSHHTGEERASQSEQGKAK